MTKLHIDVETYSSLDLKKCGLYKYTQSVDFEVLMIAYSYEGEEDTHIVDLACGEKLPSRLVLDLMNPMVIKIAHNAAFERQALKAIGYNIPPEQWACTMVKAAYCGLPMSLDALSKVLDLGEEGKMKEGKPLITYFTKPCKPTKTNGQRERNYPHHNPEKWETFKEYCKMDVIAEKAISKKLEYIAFPEREQRNYVIDQYINDNGVAIDLPFVRNAVKIDDHFKDIAVERLQQITGLGNPNSTTQLTEWLEDATGYEIDSLDKDSVTELKTKYAKHPLITEVLTLKQSTSKTSTAKYTAMLDCACEDGRAYGLFQFYGANRTGRWAGRLIQLQNMARNYMKDLALARRVIRDGDIDLAGMLYRSVPNVLSELTRTALIAPEGKALAPCDFSAIEARVLAWLAKEEWRLEVFRTHGKIYEASASRMFKIPIEQITKGSEYRQRGKVAELALGYQGSVGAMRQMDTNDDLAHMSDEAVKHMVEGWRRANPAIVKLWYAVEDAAKAAIRSRRDHHVNGLTFGMKGNTMLITLPSGRQLCYHGARLVPSGFGRESVVYMGMDQVRKVWTKIDSYGGKFVENIVQAIARDILADSLHALHQEGYKVVMHVHDEAVCEVDAATAEKDLRQISKIMTKPLNWAPDLPLAAEGFTTLYYKKD